MDMAILVPLGAGIVGLLFVVYLAFSVLAKSQGSARMIEISQAVQTGAKAFLKREYIYISMFCAVVAVVLAAFEFIRPDFGLSWRTSTAFLVGSICSAIAGYVGMSIATRANARTAQAAIDGGVQAALGVALSGGAVMGMCVVSVSLIGLSLVFIAFYDAANAVNSANIINGYAMGASLVALFARCGGGIFTKGADMGADLVGKVEAGIPEDDPRNPAVIADNVGDNVGDVAGLGSDLMESYVESIIVVMAIAATLGNVVDGGAEIVRALTFLPMYIAAAGVVASMAGIFFTKATGSKNPQAALMNGTYVAGILTVAASWFIVDRFGTDFTESGTAYKKMGPFWATIFGIVSGGVVGFVTEVYTSSKYAPVKRIAKNSESGAAITVTEGMAVGMQSCAVPVIMIALALIGAHHVAGIYGVGMAALGMLATTGMVVAVDSYGPIADNAGGIAEMAHLPKEVRKITDNLDSVGNTTAAIGKGFAIGSAAFAALGLIVAYCAAAGVTTASITDPHILAGLLIGAMMPYLFSSWLFTAVSNAAFEMIKEVRRQFQNTPGLKEGKEGVKPDYATCVDISTKGAIKGMLLPGAVAIVSPLFVGLALGQEALAGMLTGALAAGVMLGIQFATSGGAMDNAKKYVEEGHHGGKGSDVHKATVIGDTVGDPLKDTVGPSINILIKLMAVISLVFAPMLKNVEAWF